MVVTVDKTTMCYDMTPSRPISVHIPYAVYLSEMMHLHCSSMCLNK